MFCISKAVVLITVDVSRSAQLTLHKISSMSQVLSLSTSADSNGLPDIFQYYISQTVGITIIAYPVKYQHDFRKCKNVLF